ncbi:MAG: response regulator [Bilophila sp.]
MVKKILIVDDDPYIVKYISEVLSDNGYATCSASNVREALDVLKQEHPDLVTLDMEMPDEWGPRFYRKMTLLPEFKDMPVIIISGLQGIHLAIRNAVASLAKPFDPEQLLKIVESVFRSEEALQSAMHDKEMPPHTGA